jgi:hypothetical protein
MQQQVEQLSKKLDETEEVYGQLLALENSKQEAILQRDPARVLEALEMERGLVARATELENEVLRFRDAIGESLGDVPASGGEPMTLREIARVLGAPQGPALEGKRHSLMQVAISLRQVSQTNYLLLKQCVTLLEEMMQAAAGEAPGCRTYSGAGAKSRAPQAVGTMLNLVAGD